MNWKAEFGKAYKVIVHSLCLNKEYQKPVQVYNYPSPSFTYN